VNVLDGSQADVLAGTRRRILEVARGLFSERTYLGVSMSDIAGRLGITKTALYYHFASKTEIYGTVLDDVFARLRGRIAEASAEATPEGQLRRLLMNYLEFGRQEKNLINALVVGLSPGGAQVRERVVRFREELVALVQPIIEGALACRNLPAAVDSFFVSHLLMGMMDGLIVERSFLGQSVDPENVADHILALLGLRAEPSAAASR